IAASVIAYLGVLNLGFGSAYMRFYSRYNQIESKREVANLNGMFLEIFIILGVVAVVAGIFLAFNVNLIFGPSLNLNELVTARTLMIILVINLAFSFPSIIFTTYI